jgi:type IX secretion system PorP/SprF family membrane protein
MKSIPMNKIALISAFMLCVIWDTKAQFDPMYTQYMFNEVAINPGYAGSRECLSATALYRHQWVGLDGAPVTITGTVHAPFANQKMGAGITFMNDKIGVTQRTHIGLNGAYSLKLGEGNLRLGLQFGLTTLSQNLAELNLQFDQQFLLNTGKRSAPNFGFGAYYSQSNWYAGLSIPRMMKNSLDVSTGSTEVSNKVQPSDFHYYLTAGGVVNLNSFLKMRPNVMVKAVSGAPMQADVNVNFLFADRIWAGAGYRTGDAITLNIGAYVNPQIRIGYAYDDTMSPLQAYNSGTHEIMLGYDLNFVKDRVVNPRYF